MSNLYLTIDKKEFEERKKDLELAIEPGAKLREEYYLTAEVFVDQLTINEKGIWFTGEFASPGGVKNEIEALRNNVTIRLDLDDEQFLEILKVTLKKMNKWKEALKAVATLKNIEVTPTK